METPALAKTGNILSIRIDSAVSDERFQAISSEIESLASTAGRVRLVLVIKHYASLLSAEDLLDDLRFVKLYADRIDKVAVVSDKSWKRTWVGLFSLFSGVAMAFFDLSESDLASSWIQNN